MRKRISLKTRRPDLSPDEFRFYYEHHHVPLGLGFIEDFQWRRYVRNHVLSVHGRPVDFDCITEFWVDDDADDHALQRFIESPRFRVLADDDQNFLDVSRRLSFEVRETTLRSGLENTQPPSHLALSWKGNSVSDPQGQADYLVDRLGARSSHLVLNRAIGALPAAAPFDSVLYISLVEKPHLQRLASLPLMKDVSLLLLEPIETPADLLFETVSTDISRRRGAST